MTSDQADALGVWTFRVVSTLGFLGIAGLAISLFPVDHQFERWLTALLALFITARRWYVFLFTSPLPPTNPVV